MTFYQDKLNQVKAICFANEGQLQTVIATRNYINDNYDKELNLEVLSKARFTSKFHLLRLFKKYYGQTPRQYLIDKRIEKSKELLQKNWSVTETCFAVGFESLGSFSALFKNRIGKSPSKYQKEQLSRSEFT